VKIKRALFDIQREPFARPFGFKGSFFREKWNAVVRLEEAGGHEAFGLGGLAVLWSDEAVFTAHSEAGGNLIMLCLLEKALKLAEGREFADPPELLATVKDEVHGYGRLITGRPALRPTFTLNALVALDNAAWVLYARLRGGKSFTDLIPAAVRPALCHRQKQLVAVPLVTYHLPLSTVESLLQNGAGLLKIKIGQPGSEEEMLAKDMARLSEVHQVAKAYATPLTESGQVLYYLDANGRYRHKESIVRLLDHAGAIGALERIVILEEPFGEELEIDVGDLPVRIAADESLHDATAVAHKAAQGYSAIAIKPAGKTMTVAFEMASAAARHRMACYVADNACVPFLVDWNKIFAAHLPPFPGIKGGLMEANGPESYPDWPALVASSHPRAGASWLWPERGTFHLDQEFYEASGGILDDPGPVYTGLPLLR